MKKQQSALEELRSRLPQLEDAATANFKIEARERVAKAENDFTFFCEYYLPSYFFCKPAEYQKILYDVIQTRELTVEQCERLKSMVPGKFRDSFRPAKDIDGIVDVEPRGHGKSTRMTFAFPLWCLLYKKANFIVIIGASKEDAELQMSNIKLALEENEKILEDFTPQHRQGSGKTWNKSFLALENGTAVVAKGKGGSLRGIRNKEHRPDLIIVDDTFKDKEADSSVIREQVYRWFGRTVQPLGFDALIVVVNTITNEDDLPSRLLNDIRTGKKANWIGLRFSAECPAQEGDSHDRPLWPERYSWDALKKKQKDLGSIAYAIEYLSQPLGDEDRLVKSAWIQKVRAEEIPNSLRFYAGIDPATGVHDQSAMTSIGKDKDGTLYVVRSEGRTESPSAFTSRIIREYKMLHHRRILMETVQFQAVYKEQVAKDAAKDGMIIPLKGYSPGKASKAVRLMAVSPWIENGIIKFGPGTEDLLDQLLAFPAGGFDDQVDSFCMAVLATKKKGTGGLDLDGSVGIKNWRRLANL
jgi:predicted phage terminase large subunit-like protein